MIFFFSGISSHNRNVDPLGEPLKSVAKAPKVKLQISSGPAPPVLNFEPLPYGRRRKRKRSNEENGPKRVKLVISAKRLHPATKSNNILLEPLAEIQVCVYSVHRNLAIFTLKNIWEIWLLCVKLEYHAKKILQLKFTF